MSDTNNVTIELNGRKLTEQEFLLEKEKLLNSQGVELVEVSKGVYKTRLLD